jgi:hypothetical protein
VKNDCNITKLASLMNISHLFELCILERMGDGSTPPLKQDDRMQHYHEHVLLYRNGLLPHKLAKNKFPKPTVTELNVNECVESMIDALEGNKTYLKDKTYLKENVTWHLRSHERRETLVGTNEMRDVNIVITPLERIGKDSNNLLQRNTYVIMVYLSKTKKCYVINHIPIKDAKVTKILGVQPDAIYRSFRNENNSLVINLELDILRVIMAIYLDQYDIYLRNGLGIDGTGTGMDNESIDFIKGIINVDPDLEERYQNHKKLIHSLDMPQMIQTMIPFVLELNAYICHFLVQVHDLWLKNGTLPLMMLFNDDNRRRFCELNSKQRQSPPLNPNNMITTPFSSMLNKETEMIQSPLEKRQLRAENTALKTLIDKTTILTPIMNDNFVERSKHAIKIIERHNTLPDQVKTKAFDIRGMYTFDALTPLQCTNEDKENDLEQDHDSSEDNGTIFIENDDLGESYSYYSFSSDVDEDDIEEC